MPSKFRLTIAFALAVVVLGGAALAVTRWSTLITAPPDAAFGGPFTLTASDRRTVTDATYRGKWLLIYFGYTFCPDACPTVLNEISGALVTLGPTANNIQPLFITVDPKRDTPEVMAEYLKSFDPRIVGLTGTPAQTAAAARQYHVSYVIDGADDGNYLIDHSSFVYVVSPEGRFVKPLPGGMSSDELAEELRKVIAEAS